MPSPSKENVPSTISAARPSAAMNEGDVFSSSAASEMMLSPPPEEELRFSRRPSNSPNSASKPLTNSMRPNQQSPTAYQATKRKRAITGASTPSVSQNQLENSGGIQHTPNPRVRKQVRYAAASPDHTRSMYEDASLGSPSRQDGSQPRTRMQNGPPVTPTHKGNSRGRSTELAGESPHKSNPDADYIPPSRLAISPRGVSVRRRSVTPIPPYEPPKERYTPPREVVVSPPAAERKPMRRATGKKKRVTVKTEKPPVQLRVKTEPPEVDLTSPPPPASPGDDPILLVGPPSIRVHRPSLPPADSREVSLVKFEMDLDLPKNKDSVIPGASQQEGVVRSPARSSSVAAAFDFSNISADDVGRGYADTSFETDFGTVIDGGNFANAVDDGWSDSDSDNGNGNGEEGTSIGEGDFTGTFLTFKAPVKLDPPADGSEDRMEKWARPISPHPKRFSLVKQEDDDADEVSLDESNEKTSQTSNVTDQNDEATGNENDQEAEAQEGQCPGYADRRGRRLTLTEVEAMKFGPRSSISTSSPANKNDDSGYSNEDQVRDFEDVLLHQSHNLSGEHNDYFNRNGSTQEDAEKRDTILNDTSSLDSLQDRFDSTHIQDESFCQQNAHVEDENDTPPRSASEQSYGGSSQSTLTNPGATSVEHREQIAHKEHQAYLFKHDEDASQEVSTSHDASVLKESCAPTNLSDCETEIAAEEVHSDDSDDAASDLSVVKIVSDDPMAAARAAAILKMHDYDMVARKLRRRRTTTGGVSKPYGTPKNTQLWRRRTVAGLSAEDALSANILLPDLLEKAEEELRESPCRSRSGSVALSSIGSPQKARWDGIMHENTDVPGFREWTKADWKLLDSCFTDERYDLGEQLGLEAGCLADVEDVPLGCVVERFVELMGGAELVQSHGPSWNMDKLMSRAKALCKRQRSGHGAPPTPDVSARFSTPSRFATSSPSPSMIVPDFTPAASERTRLFDYGSVSRKATLPPPSSDAFFKVPALPARHSRLREDVTSAVLETPRPSRALDLFGFATPSRNVPQQQQEEDDSDDDSIVQEVDAMLTPVTAARVRESRPESAVKRSLSYISSWLKPDMYKSRKEERYGSPLPGLPAPPSDVLSKPRGPVETPAPKPAEKPIPHKELVSLEHVPPPKPTRIPRRQRPQRLVDLNHVPTPQPKEDAKNASSRRSSTSSVKDLIREFEEKERGKVQAVPPRVAELRRQASVGSLKAGGKPGWKP